MRRTFLVFILIMGVTSLFSQYLPVAEQGKTWYSLAYVGYSSPPYYYTEIVKVDGDTTLGGKVYPLLKEMEQTGALKKTLGYLDEDTTVGTLVIHFFDPSKPVQYYDFSLQKGDTVRYSSYFFSNQTDSAVVDTVYSFTDFRGIHRKVIEFKEADMLSRCGNALPAWVEGLGSAYLPAPLPVCASLHVPAFTLSCVYNNKGVKLFGDSVQPCFFTDMDLAEPGGVGSFQIYPNPGSDFLNLDFEETIEEVLIYNVNGRLMKREPGGHKIGVADLAPGAYLVEVRGKKTASFGRVVKN